MVILKSNFLRRLATIDSRHDFLLRVTTESIVPIADNRDGIRNQSGLFVQLREIRPVALRHISK